MRILHVVARSQRRGAETAAIELAAELDRRGHTDVVVALRPAFDGGTIDAAPVLDGRGQRLGGLARRMRRELRRVGPDLVVAHGGEAAAVLALARRRSGPPVVWQRILGFPASMWSSVPRRWWWSWIDRRSAAVVALTTDLAAEQSRLGRRDPAWVIPNFRRPGPFLEIDHVAAAQALRSELSLGEERLLVGLVGHLVEQKRPDRAVEVLGRVVDAGLDVHLVVAGTGPLAEAVAKQVAAAGLSSHVSMVGHRDDIATVLGALDALLLVSDDEGIPGVLIEAQLTGCPVVTVAVGGVAEVVADAVTGRVVHGDDDAVADALARLLADPVGAASMRIAARERAVRFSVEAAADAYEAGFSSLVADWPSTTGSSSTAGSSSSGPPPS